jgi:hypothetical protein
VAGQTPSCLAEAAPAAAAGSVLVHGHLIAVDFILVALLDARQGNACLDAANFLGGVARQPVRGDAFLPFSAPVYHARRETALRGHILRQKLQDWRCWPWVEPFAETTGRYRCSQRRACWSTCQTWPVISLSEFLQTAAWAYTANQEREERDRRELELINRNAGRRTLSRPATDEAHLSAS